MQIYWEIDLSNVYRGNKRKSAWQKPGAFVIHDVMVL
jgi:hypothetical protein